MSNVRILLINIQKLYYLWKTHSSLIQTLSLEIWNQTSKFWVSIHLRDSLLKVKFDVSIQDIDDIASELTNQEWLFWQ